MSAAHPGKRCLHCDRPLRPPLPGWSKFCSKTCRMEAQTKRSAEWRHTPDGWLWWALYLARRRAGSLKIPFALVREDLTPPPKVCPVLGIKLDYGKKRYVGDTRDESPSLDRVIDERGYVSGNVRVISYRANRIKNNGTLEEHRAIVKYLKKETRR